MDILCRSSAIVRSANVRNILFIVVGICGVFQLVHGRHRDIGNVPYESALKYDSQLSSAEKSINDGKLLCPNYLRKKNQQQQKQNQKIKNTITANKLISVVFFIQM